jgi:hypothetical protein
MMLHQCRVLRESALHAIFQFDLLARITTTFGKGTATGRFILRTTCFGTSFLRRRFHHSTKPVIERIAGVKPPKA